jgi:hypothetical protein
MHIVKFVCFVDANNGKNGLFRNAFGCKHTQKNKAICEKKIKDFNWEACSECRFQFRNNLNSIYITVSITSKARGYNKIFIKCFNRKTMLNKG